MPWCCARRAPAPCPGARERSGGGRGGASAPWRRPSGSAGANRRSSPAPKPPRLGSSIPPRRRGCSVIRACRSASSSIGPRTGSHAACRASARTPITIPAMATSEPRLTVKESLTPSELDDVDALVREAPWNQLAAAWRIFIEFGRVYAVHSADGRIIATTATLPYGGRFAWISMVLVAGEYRRRGLGTMMLRRAMADLTAAKLVPALD